MGPGWVAAAGPGASRGALPTVLLALPAAGRGLVAGLAAAAEPVAGLVASYAASVAELVQRFRPSWCISHRFVRLSCIIGHRFALFYDAEFSYHLAACNALGKLPETAFACGLERTQRYWFAERRFAY